MKINKIVIQETFVLGKRPEPELCEDLIFQSPDFMAVIDGATSRVSDYKTPSGETTGKIAARIVHDALIHLDPHSTAKQAVKVINQDLQKYYLENNLLEIVTKHPEKRLTASAIIFSKARREIWSIGDCQALIGDIYFGLYHKGVDNVLAKLRSFYLNTEIAKGKTVEELLTDQTAERKLLNPLICSQYIFQNNFFENDFSYAALDGFPVAKDKIFVFSIPDKTEEIVLTSDGYPDIFSSLEETEKNLQEALAQDPLCIAANYGTKGLVKGNNSYDDRTYFRFHLSWQKEKKDIQKNSQKLTFKKIIRKNLGNFSLICQVIPESFSVVYWSDKTQRGVHQVKSSQQWFGHKGSFYQDSSMSKPFKNEAAAVRWLLKIKKKAK